MIAESPTPTAVRTTGQKKWTYDEIAAIKDDRLRELHDGRTILMPAPSLRHQKLYLRLLLTIQRWMDAGGQGLLYPQPVDLKIDQFNALIPDLIYYLTNDESAVESKNGNYLKGVPDLIVEVISPSSVKIDRVYKSETYAKMGVPFYWIIDPAGRVFQAFRLVEGEYRFNANLADEGEFAPAGLPGLIVPMEELFGPREPEDETE